MLVISDYEIRNWLIPEEFIKELDESKSNCGADPPPLHHDDHLVEPSHTQEVINGATVEVHFGILHCHIGNFDSFWANVDKSIILKLGYEHHTFKYKHPHRDYILSEPETKKSRHN